jgi:hypothetical protein
MSKTALIDILFPTTASNGQHAPGTTTGLIGALMADAPEGIVTIAGGHLPASVPEARSMLMAAPADTMKDALTAIISAMSKAKENTPYADRARWMLNVLEGGPTSADPGPWTSNAFAALVDLLLGGNSNWGKAPTMAATLMDAMRPVLHTHHCAIHAGFTVPARLLHRLTVAAGERGIDTTALAPFTSEGNPDWFIAYEGPYTAAEVDAFIRLERARAGTRDVTYPGAEDAVRMLSTVCALAHAEGASAHQDRMLALINEAEGLVPAACEGIDADMESYHLVELAQAALAIGARDKANALVDRALTYGNSAPYNTPPLADVLVKLGRFDDIPTVVAAAGTWWGGIEAWCLAVKGTNGRADMVEALRNSVMHAPEEMAALTGDALSEAARNCTSAAEALMDAGVDAADVIARADALVERMVTEDNEDLSLVQPELAVLLVRNGACERGEALIAGLTDTDDRNEAWLDIAEAAARKGVGSTVVEAMGRITDPAVAYRCALNVAGTMASEADTWLTVATTHAARIANDRERLDALYRVIALRRDAGLPITTERAVLMEQCATMDAPELAGPIAWMLIDLGAIEEGIAHTARMSDTMEMRLTMADALTDAGATDRIANLFIR